MANEASRRYLEKSLETPALDNGILTHIIFIVPNSKPLVLLRYGQAITHTVTDTIYTAVIGISQTIYIAPDTRPLCSNETTLTA